MRLRWAISLILFPLFQFCWGQAPLKHKLDFSIENQSLPQALVRLSEASGVEIAFSSRFFDRDALVSGSFQNAELGEILDALLVETDVEAREMGVGVLLVRRKQKLIPYSGYVVDEESGEALVGASVFCAELGKGTVANEYGFFSLGLPRGKHRVRFRYVGYTEKAREVELKEARQEKVALHADLVLQKVVISPELAEAPVSAIETGRGISLNPGLVEGSPTLGGVVDHVRASQLLPGVQGGVDGIAGLHVRGGDPGHNLMLLDGVPIFIPFHLLGAYSVYNANTVKAANLIKGGFSARYGGRLASVFDVRTREGDLYKWHAGATMGLSLLQANIEGPIKKEKGAILVSGRLAPGAILLGTVFDRLYFAENGGSLESGFYDLNVKTNWVLGKKDRIYLSYFMGGDKFGKEFEGEGDDESSELETEIEWGNLASSLRWNHLFSDKLFSNTSLTYSLFSYKYTTFNRFSPADSTALQSLFFVDSRSENQHFGLRSDFDFHPNTRHQIRFGGGVGLPFFNSILSYFDQDFDVLAGLDTVDRATLEALAEGIDNHATEFQGYFEDRISLSPKLKASLGLRMSIFVHSQDPLWMPEPRVGLYYNPRPEFSFHLQATRMGQFFHLVPNTALRFPSDIWFTSNEVLRPQESWTFETGGSVQLLPQLRLSTDLYCKTYHNLYALPDSLNFLQTADLASPETFLLNGTGLSYGAEFMAVYQGKRSQGLLAYTLSKSERKFEGLNLGLPFPHAFDRRHQLSFFFSQLIGKGFQVGFNWDWMSGNPRLGLATVQSGIGLASTEIHPPGQKNRVRGPSYHRLDVNVGYRFETGPIRHQLKAGLYNAYNQMNVAYYEVNSSILNPVSSIPIRPSISYDLRF